MTQVQSIQANIHHTRTELNKSRRVVCKNDLEKLHNQSAIDFYLCELKDLRACLKLAIAIS